MRTWQRRGLMACALLPLSWIFGFLIAIRRMFYRFGWLAPVRLPVPVIVVGNIFIGGTGKTPLTIALVSALREAGFRPGIISRGYGGSNRQPRPVSTDSLPGDVGDEPVLMAQRTGCPVMVGRDRVAAAQALLTAYPLVNLIVSDDGLQHYRLGRDIEIVLFDARGTGNGWLLPAGPLREPAGRPRDFTVVNAADIPCGVSQSAVRMRLAGHFAEQLADKTQVLELQALSKESNSSGRTPRILAAAGIGNPARFFTMLRAAGLEIAEMPLPDHYDYADNPFISVAADIILITEKDAVKCRRIDALKDEPRLWVVPVTAQLDAALTEPILEKLRGHSIA